MNSLEYHPRAQSSGKLWKKNAEEVVQDGLIMCVCVCDVCVWGVGWVTESKSRP